MKITIQNLNLSALFLIKFGYQTFLTGDLTTIFGDQPATEKKCVHMYVICHDGVTNNNMLLTLCWTLPNLDERR